MENDNEKEKVRVEVVENGPLKIYGNFVLRDLKRNREQKPGYIELCRCGRSKDKPYCDGSHEQP